MRESKYVPIILETIGEKSASIGTLKRKCGQGNKITNIRKALHQLIKEDIIEVNGYDKECQNFSYDCIKLKKVDTNYKNPIYVKGLLDNPRDNYKGIREVFKKRIEQINQIFLSEAKLLEDSIDKMSLKDAINDEYIKPGEVIKKVMGEYPNAMGWYLKKRFSSKLAMTLMDSRSLERGPPYFIKSQRKFLDLNGTENKQDFVRKHYKSLFEHLPLEEWQEHLLFRFLVIHALRDTEDKDTRLWNLASDLTEDGSVLISFVSELDSELDIIIDIANERVRDHGKTIRF